MAAARSTRAAISAFGIFFNPSAKPMFSRTRMCG